MVHKRKIYSPFLSSYENQETAPKISVKPPGECMTPLEKITQGEGRRGGRKTALPQLTKSLENRATE